MNQANRGPVITAALRTPIGTTGKALADVECTELAAAVLTGLASTAAVEEVLLGNCMGAGGNVARVSALAAGLAPTTPAVTIDRQCASGLAAIALGAGLVAQGASLILAGGTESPSTAPIRAWAGDPPRPYSRAPFAPAQVGDPEMAEAADELAARHRIGRAEQDWYAARSHALAWQAVTDGSFADELVPVGQITTDERPRPGLSVERLSRLKPVEPGGRTVTAGNSCGINDGAAAVRIQPTGPGLRVLATASAGVDPTLPGIGLVPAVRSALTRAGLSLDQMDVIEFNEAFAGQILACCQSLSLDPERVCRQGGALGLGHPWGASGAVLAVRLFHQLMPGTGRYGLAAIAAGGGQGTAIVVEACR